MLWLLTNSDTVLSSQGQRGPAQERPKESHSGGTDDDASSKIENNK